jgi:hypothetical protein
MATGPKAILQDFTDRLTRILSNVNIMLHDVESEPKAELLDPAIRDSLRNTLRKVRKEVSAIMSMCESAKFYAEE